MMEKNYKGCPTKLRDNGDGAKMLNGGRVRPPFNIYAPKPRKRVPLLCPVPFCPNAFLMRWVGGHE